MAEGDYYRFRGDFLALCYLSVIIVRMLTSGPVEAAGIWLVITGWAIRIWSGIYIGTHTNSLEPAGNSLAKNGPYSLSRNPMYIGNLFICAGILIYGNCFYPWISVIYVLVIAYFFNNAVKREEQYLLEHFPLEAESYFNAVPRWISVKSFRKIPDRSGQTTFKEVFKNQYKHILKSAAALVILALF